MDQSAADTDLDNCCDNLIRIVTLFLQSNLGKHLSDSNRGAFLDQLRDFVYQAGHFSVFRCKLSDCNIENEVLTIVVDTQHTNKRRVFTVGFNDSEAFLKEL